jgi:hypothetical protein
MSSANQPRGRLGLRWGAKSIGEYIGRSEREIWYMYNRGLLPMVRRHGRLLEARESELDQHFSAAKQAATPEDASRADRRHEADSATAEPAPQT